MANTKRLTPVQKAKKLATEKADLQRQLDEARTELAVKQDADLDVLAATELAPVPEATSDLADPELIYDPFSGQNPHAIKAHPPGFKLGWKSERYRGHRGWRGWEKISYDDEYGQNLNDYINDPPRRMEHSTDMYVRRGDVILCRLPEGIWLARQQQRVDKAHRFAREHAADMRIDSISSERDLVSETDQKSIFRGNMTR